MRCCYLLIGGLWILAVRLPASEEFFEKQIRPALIEHCYKCHSADAEKIKGGLRVDSRGGLLTGGDSGPAIVPGKPDESLLIKAVRRLDKDLAMPPKKELAESVINAFVEWVRIGAPDPRKETAKAAPLPPVEEKPPIDYAAARKNWAFRTPMRPVIPHIRNESWSEHPIDRFIAAQLEEKQLLPAARAEKRALIRRATFDLTGLPPTQAEVEAFVRDDSTQAFAHVIDRLLASPHYGERWARHWLDVVRYTDLFDARGTGAARNVDCTEAWRYRDWVVDQLNADLPYDDFILQQIAGDILAAQEFDAAKIVATGVYAIGNWGGGDADKEKLLTDIVDDQIDLTGRAFLGLTIACARCHDHKFDPISAEDYYGLAGIFFSSHILPNPGLKTTGPDILRISLLHPEERRQRDEVRKRMGAIDAELARGLRRMTRVLRDVHGKAGLIGWQLPDLDQPSVAINSTAAEIAFSTTKLPGGGIALHPGPSVPVTAAWRSPISGPITVRARLRDVDPTCGDGIAWEVRQGMRSLASGNMENGGETTVAEQRLVVERGDFVQLIIRPRREYSCDTTQLELIVRSAADEQMWDLRETLFADPANVAHGVWAICAGDGERLTEDLPAHAALLVERAALAAKVAAPESVAHGLQEGGCPESAHAGVHDVKVHIRGRYDRLGPLVPRRFPKLLAGDTPAPVNEGSGRLALARWIANENNPLTARVMVNRVWQHHFGEGIVRTANNFGKLGTPPTHPELLDWLTCEFVRNGWSLKKLHRLIMSSATYQQSTAGDVETRLRDPDNLMFGRMNRRRLDAESIRDSLLTVSGKLDRQRGGPAVPALDTPRRTLYLLTVRSDQTTYRSLFDAPDPSAIVEKRIDSTVAPQALFFLNDPFVLGQARGLRERVDREVASPDPAARIEWLYRELFARPPRDEEIGVGRAALEALREHGAGAWTLYCQTLLAGAEFVYLD